MELIEYQGGNFGVEQYIGKVSRAGYAFGGSRRQGWIDARDLTWFLSLKEAGKPLFRRVNEPEAEQPTTTEPETAEPETPVGGEPQAKSTDYAGMTVAEIKELDLDDAGWDEVLRQENEGKGRISVIEFAKAKLEDDAG